MRRVSAILCGVSFALIAFAATAADAPAYNKTDTFEPGKKYTCVPTADRKNWNCNEAGKATTPPEPDASAPIPSVATHGAAPITDSPEAVARPASHSSALPSYLTSAAAENPSQPAAAPSTISAAANHANAPPPPRPSNAAPTPPMSSTNTAAPTKTSKASPVMRPASASVPQAKPTNGGGFLDLPSDRFVIELTHASTQNTLTDARNAIHVPHGDIYELHLRQNSADTWLLLWGTFDSVEAARAARSELAHTTSTVLGFPRRIAPLQAEARRVSE